MGPLGKIGERIYPRILRLFCGRSKKDKYGLFLGPPDPKKFRHLAHRDLLRHLFVFESAFLLFIFLWLATFSFYEDQLFTKLFSFTLTIIVLYPLGLAIFMQIDICRQIALRRRHRAKNCARCQ